MKIDKLISDKRKDPQFNQYYLAEKDKLETAYALLEARENAGLTQQELADKAHTTQATIARIERGDNVSFTKLQNIATALHKRLKVEFV